MKIRILLAAAGVVLMLAAPVWAQSTTVSTATTTSTRTFDSLSPGNQKITNSLFAAQNTNGTNLTPLTKDQIAGLKGTEGWGRVFKQMKADGLIQAKNLGQVVSAHQHELNAARRGSGGTTARNARSGRSTMMASARTHGRFGVGGRGFADGSHRMGGGVAVSTMGSSGFGHGGMGGGFGHGGMGGGISGGFGGGGHGGGHGR